MRNTKIVFVILMVSGIVGMFYTLIPILSNVPSDIFLESQYCNNSTLNPVSSIFHIILPTTERNLVNNTTENKTEIISDILLDGKKKIFLMETSGKSSLNARQACAVESAARQNPSMHVVVYFVSPSLDLSNQEILTLAEIPNISFQYLNLNQYFNCSPLLSWYNKGSWKKSPYKISHMSDALRFLTLWKFGGIYLDLDVVIIKPLVQLRNCAGKESHIVVAPGVMTFDKGHQFLAECLKEFSYTYRGNDWGWNGPHLITRVLKRICGDIQNLDQVSRDRCKGVSILPVNAFYALEWASWKDFFNKSKTEEVMSKINSSYLIHVWNKHSYKTPVKIGSGAPYEIIAKKFCPSIYGVQKVSF